MRNIKDARIFLPIIFLASLAVALLLVSLLDDPLVHLREIFVERFFFVSAISYVIALALSVPLLPFTISPLIPFFSKIFGPELAFSLSLLGYGIGSIAAFSIARVSGEGIVGRLFPEKRLRDYDHVYKTTHNFTERLALRFFSPIDSWSYTSGLRDKTIHIKSFLLVSLLGSIPSVFILTYSADAIGSGDRNELFALFFAAILIALSFFYIRYIHGYKKAVKIYTHDFQFHTDDVFAVAALYLYLEEKGETVKVIRTRDEKILEKAIHNKKINERFIVDVGLYNDPDRNLFDHHQEGGAGVRENGVPYSSIGLVWKKYGTIICGDVQAAVILEQRIIWQMDMLDNGQDVSQRIRKDIAPYDLRNIIEGAFRPIDSSLESYNDAFDAAVQFAKSLLIKEIAHAKAEQEKRISALKAYNESERKDLIISDEKIGRKYFTHLEGTKFIVSRRNQEEKSDWGVATIPLEEDSFETKAFFPSDWAGKRDDELEKISGVKGAKYCHHSGQFIAVALTKEAAIEMAEIALQKMGDQKN